MKKILIIICAFLAIVCIVQLVIITNLNEREQATDLGRYTQSIRVPLPAGWTYAGNASVELGSGSGIRSSTGDGRHASRLYWKEDYLLRYQPGTGEAASPGTVNTVLPAVTAKLSDAICGRLGGCVDRRIFYTDGLSMVQLIEYPKGTVIIHSTFGRSGDKVDINTVKVDVYRVFSSGE